MKKLAIVLSLFALGTTVSAQKIDLGVGGVFALPMGDFADATEMGYGGNISVNYFIMPNLSAGIEVGGIFFQEKSEGGVSNLFTSFPIQAVGKYYFMDNAFKPYGGLGLGYFLMQNEVRYSDDLQALGLTNQTTDQAGFGISPRLGFDYAFNKWVALNFEVNYNLLFNETKEKITVTIDNPLDPANPIESEAEVTYPATPFLGVNLGLKFTLFDNSPEIF
ncbi:MAG: hypothetical protein SchgKO_24620 [Schleiferiaceae bacterium]